MSHMNMSELISESEKFLKPFDIPDKIFQKTAYDEYFIPTLGDNCYTFWCWFRDLDEDYLYYERRIFLTQDAKLYVARKNLNYDLKNMNISVVYQPYKNILSLTDKITMQIENDYDYETAAIFKAVLEKNNIDYQTPADFINEQFPAYYGIMDISEYFRDISWNNVLEDKRHRKIISGLYSYDVYLQKMLLTALDMNIVDSILYEDQDYVLSKFKAPLAEAIGCREFRAEQAIELLCSMKKCGWISADKDEELYMLRFKNYELESFLEENGMLDKYYNHINTIVASGGDDLGTSSVPTRILQDALLRDKKNRMLKSLQMNNP